MAATDSVRSCQYNAFSLQEYLPSRRCFFDAWSGREIRTGACPYRSELHPYTGRWRSATCIHNHAVRRDFCLVLGPHFSVEVQCSVFGSSNSRLRVHVQRQLCLTGKPADVPIEPAVLLFLKVSSADCASFQNFICANHGDTHT